MCLLAWNEHFTLLSSFCVRRPCNSEKDWSIHFVVVHRLLCWSIDTSSLVNFVLSFLFHHETTAKAKFSFYAKENGSWVFWAFFCQLFLFSELSVILQITFWLYDYNDLGQFIQLYYLQCQPPCWCYFIFFYKGIKTVKSKKTIIYTALVMFWMMSVV